MTVFSKLVPVRFVAFVERVVETLQGSGCTGRPPVMTIGHFLYSAFTALPGQLPVPDDVVYEGSRLLALCEAGSHASLPNICLVKSAGCRLWAVPDCQFCARCYSGCISPRPNWSGVVIGVACNGAWRPFEILAECRLAHQGQGC